VHTLVHCICKSPSNKFLKRHQVTILDNHKNKKNKNDSKKRTRRKHKQKKTHDKNKKNKENKKKRDKKNTVKNNNSYRLLNCTCTRAGFRGTNFFPRISTHASLQTMGFDLHSHKHLICESVLKTFADT